MRPVRRLTSCCCSERGFLVGVAFPFRFYIRFQQAGLGFGGAIVVFLAGDLAFEVFEGFFVPRKVVYRQFDAQFFVFIFQRIVFLGALGLFFEFFQLVLDLEQQIFHAVEVGGSGFQFELGFVFPD